MTTNKFHYKKFGIIQISVETLSQPKSQIHSNSSLSKIQTKELKVHRYRIRIPNTKYELHKNQRESYKTNSKVAIHQERANHQTAKPKLSGNKTSLTIPNCNPQISNNQTKREPFSHTHTHTLFSFSLIFRSNTVYIGDLSRLEYPKPRTRLLSTHKRRITLIPNRTQNQVVDKTSNKA